MTIGWLEWISSKLSSMGLFEDLVHLTVESKKSKWEKNQRWFGTIYHILMNIFICDKELKLLLVTGMVWKVFKTCLGQTVPDMLVVKFKDFFYRNRAWNSVCGSVTLCRTKICERKVFFTHLFVQGLSQAIGWDYQPFSLDPLLMFQKSVVH